MEFEPLRRNRQPAMPIWTPHIQNNLFVHEKLVVEPQVVAIGIELSCFVRLNDNVRAEASLNLIAAEDHVPGAVMAGNGQTEAARWS